jgi:nitrite reductase/ring-hydroxylating ferredoxin subunit
MKFVSVGKFGVGVYNVDGELRAVTNYCPHRGGPLCLGIRTPIITAKETYKIEATGKDEILRCPWHGHEFDLRDGRSLVTSKRVRAHAVRVEDGMIILEGV